MPVAFNNWEDGQWKEIASVNYSGTLANGDFFSLLNCDYGIAHPNSYYGNSTTDPWFAVLDANNNYMQYSPKMITELPVNSLNNTFKIYPVPTNNDLQIEIESVIATDAAAKILDINGRVIKIVNFEINKGKSINTINIGALPAGDYFINVTDGKTLNYNQKISKI